MRRQECAHARRDAQLMVAFNAFHIQHFLTVGHAQMHGFVDLVTHRLEDGPGVLAHIHVADCSKAHFQQHRPGAVLAPTAFLDGKAVMD